MLYIVLEMNRRGLIWTMMFSQRICNIMQFLARTEFDDTASGKKNAHPINAIKYAYTYIHSCKMGFDHSLVE